MVGLIGLWLAGSDSGPSRSLPYCVATRLLQYWSHFFLKGVAGAIPGISATDLTYQLQSTIEEAHHNDSAIYGLSCDIVKCFNCLPRLPGKRLLRKLGMPEAICDMYYNTLLKVSRTFSIDGNLSALCSATIGFPEGCPMSVPVMAAYS